MTHNIFHIGYHKTATTWFQKYFYPNVKNYNILDREVGQSYFLSNPLNESDLDCPENFIYCDEELSGNIHTGGSNGHISKNVADKIKSFNKDATIVIFIRKQDKMIESIYKQYIKKGGTYNINKYLFHEEFASFHRTPLFCFDHLSYIDLIEYYSKLFGKKNVKVYLYEIFQKDPVNFLKSYVEDLNLEIDLNKLNHSKMNKGHSSSFIDILRVLNLFSRKDVLYKHTIIDFGLSLKTIERIEKIHKILFKKNKKLLTPKLEKYINDYYSSCNIKLEKNYNLKLQEFWK